MDSKEATRRSNVHKMDPNDAHTCVLRFVFFVVASLVLELHVKQVEYFRQALQIHCTLPLFDCGLLFYQAICMQIAL